MQVLHCPRCRGALGDETNLCPSCGWRQGESASAPWPTPEEQGWRPAPIPETPWPAPRGTPAGKIILWVALAVGGAILLTVILAAVVFVLVSRAG